MARIYKQNNKRKPSLIIEKVFINQYNFYYNV